MFSDPRITKLAGAVVAVLAVLAVTISITTESHNDGHGNQTKKIVVHIDGIDKDRKANNKLVLTGKSAALVQKLSDTTTGDLGDSGLDAGATPQPLGGPLAAQDFPGCRTQFVRNMSSRNGSRVRIIVLHYTVGRDTGWISTNALTAMSNNPVNGVSWNFNIGGRTGTCAYNVPLSMKAWTQANANPFSVGIEVTAYGDESSYVSGPGQARLTQVVREIERRTGIPNQRGLVRDCQPIRSGIVRHVDLGLCGGGHHDTDPFADPIPGLVHDIAVKTQTVISAHDRAACQRSHAYHQRRHHTTQGTKNQQRRIQRLHGRKFGCRHGRVVRI